MLSDPHLKPSLVDRFLSMIEQKPASDRLFLRLLFFVVLGTGLALAIALNAQYIQVTPTEGGDLVEGVIGTPRFVNPALAITRADQDMVALVYSGLLKIDPEGNLVPDIAEKIEISEDGRTYHITLKQNVYFHDGTPLTARDVAYTYTLIQNPDLKSPLRGNWDGVLIEELGEYELNVVLEEAYAPFMENFTVGILPRHIWDKLPIEQLPFSQHNTEPIGSGPFKVETPKRNTSGLVSAYVLDRFDDAITPAKLDTLEVRFFENESALDTAFLAGELTSSAALTTDALQQLNTKKYHIVNSTLPRNFGIFFNQNRSAILRESDVRKALNLAINRQAIIDDVLGGYGTVSTGPIPPGWLSEPSPGKASSTDQLEQAKEVLRADGWKQIEDGSWQKDIDDVPYTLAVTLRTTNSPLFEATANKVADQWRALGVLVNVEQFEQSDLLQAVIRPRDFEALLFGTDLSRSVDLYPFWHSSQKDDPGLNIAQYTNIDVDSLLSTARTSQNEAERATTLQRAGSIIGSELPAIFLYSPVLTYAVNSDFTITPIEHVSRPYERFMNIEDWHAKTGTLWPIFDGK